MSIVSRCAAAHVGDPRECAGPREAVRVVDLAGGEATGCVLHGAVLLASLESGRVYPGPDKVDGAAIEVYRWAQTLVPSDFLCGPGMAGVPDLQRILVSVVDKEGPHWRINGICPESVAESGYLHVYRGRHAIVRDGVTDDVIVTGRSLNDVLTRLATRTGLQVLLTDEITWQERTYDPGTVTR